MTKFIDFLRSFSSASVHVIFLSKFWVLCFQGIALADQILNKPSDTTTSVETPGTIQLLNCSGFWRSFYFPAMDCRFIDALVCVREALLNSSKKIVQQHAFIYLLFFSFNQELAYTCFRCSASHRLLPLACVGALGTFCIFSHSWHQLPFSPRLAWIRFFASSTDWFIWLFAFLWLVRVRRYTLGLVLRQSLETALVPRFYLFNLPH